MVLSQTSQKRRLPDREILPSSKFDQQRNIFTALAKGGGIHEQTLRLSFKANRELDWVLEDYQGGKVIEAKDKEMTCMQRL